MPTIRYPADLPITARREEIIAAIRLHQVVILAGETGSGKTTQLPKMCLEALPERSGKIGCTQPRRVAAQSVSRRVAEELQVVWGREVGCKMRFSDDTSRETQVKFMTDGILLAEIQSDPLLRAYSVLILDEAHERSLNIDFLLGYLQELLKRRPDLKLLVTSATIDTEAFSVAFGGAPIVEVSGRLFPVEVRYAPVAASADADEGDYIEAASMAVEDLLIETDSGDVLVFFPTERDIREARELMEGRFGAGTEVLTLFGRMPASEQQRVFAPQKKRRVILATNVAETSITIPRIRCVVDTGLARISRYNPRTRTKRLPVEPISQSSANQRAGRAGRVQDGVCLRLYAREDFDQRPKFTQPEIQRSNLAEVILRMKAFRLGEIEKFPFIDRPSGAAIRSGYQLLHELGALDDLHEMTHTGRELARLPVDPTLGRMLLQARKEKALPEMLIIAAGLSVPDPRERPEEAREQAAAAHKAFVCRDSDFLSLLRIWRAAPDPEASSRNALRRFCKANFLSLTRMREWRDIWRQLEEALDDEDQGAGQSPARPASDAAIHRCILAGHLGHIARREERNVYKAGGNRQVTLFPGSNLYERRDKNLLRQADPGKFRQAAWIVAGEIVHTTQLFARMAAAIDPGWVAELGSHLCQYRYSEPHWNERSGRVLVWQRTVVHGLEVAKQTIDFGKIDPEAATEMFIREALIDGETPLPHRFYSTNQKLREKIETALTRVRSTRVYALDRALFAFYAARIQNVSSIADLDRLIAARQVANPDFLCATEHDLTGGSEIEEDLALFPNQITLANAVLPVSYAYDPGEEHDGVTVKVPLPLAVHLSSGQIQWMVPGLREEIVGVLLRSLPKALRRQLMPMDAKIPEIVREFDPGRREFLEEFAAHLTKRYRCEVKPADWPCGCLPLHLQPRVEVVDQKQQMVAGGRDLSAIRQAVEKRDHRTGAWDQAVQRIERYSLTSWSFGDLPETVEIERINGAVVLGYPGLEVQKDGAVNLRLFRREEERLAATPAGIRRLGERELGKEVAWQWKDLRSQGVSPKSTSAKPQNMAEALSQLSIKVRAEESIPVCQVTADLPTATQEHILAHALKLEPLLPLTHQRFRDMCLAARRDLPTLTARVRDLVRHCLQLRDQILAARPRYPSLETDLHRLVSPRFPADVPHSQLSHVPRFLRAVQIRAERAALSPAKDLEKAKPLAAFANWSAKVPISQHETFRWLIEEYRVSLFAQELGTAQPVSLKRLQPYLTLES